MQTGDGFKHTNAETQAEYITYIVLAVYGLWDALVFSSSVLRESGPCTSCRQRCLEKSCQCIKAHTVSINTIY